MRRGRTKGLRPAMRCAAVSAMVCWAAAATLSAQGAPPRADEPARVESSQPEATTQPASQPASTTQPSSTTQPTSEKPGPWDTGRDTFFKLKYERPGYLDTCDCSNNEARLRYNEDYSFLDEDSEALTDDPMLVFKNIDLGDQWRFDFGGEFRVRMENRTNPLFGQGDRTANTKQNYRWMLHFNLHYGDLFRVFVQGIVTHVEDQDGPFEPTQENHGDLQQLFVDASVLGEDVPLTLRVGRQELSYGHARIIGAFEWVSNRRRFDGFKLFYVGEKWNVDAFWVRPVVVERTASDDWNRDYSLYGVYSTWKGLPDHGLDLYFLGVDRSDEALNPNGHEGGRSTYTMGARFYGKTGPFDYDTEVAGQWGRWAHDSVQAWFWELDGGYTFPHVMKPRIGGGVGLSTGDDNPYDRNVGTWDQLFTYDFACVSFPDTVGRQNVRRAWISGEFWPIPDKLQIKGFYQLYCLDESTDAYYNAAGIPVLHDMFGHHGRDLGSEMDLYAQWKLNSHSTLFLGYSHFWNGAFIQNQVDGDDEEDLFIVQYQYKF